MVQGQRLRNGKGDGLEVGGGGSEQVQVLTQILVPLLQGKRNYNEKR